VLDPAAAYAFEALASNQRELARAIEQLSDTLASLTLSIIASGHVSEKTYQTVRKRVAENRKELQHEPSELLAAMFKATKPSEN
jgi:hypothetical protein